MALRSENLPGLFRRAKRKRAASVPLPALETGVGIATVVGVFTSLVAFFAVLVYVMETSPINNARGWPRLPNEKAFFIGALALGPIVGVICRFLLWRITRRVDDARWRVGE